MLENIFCRHVAIKKMPKALEMEVIKFSNWILLNYEQLGINPCGWCGLDGCRTQLITTETKAENITYKITSNCTYHYVGMIYSKAIEFRSTSPCTNVPLNCPLCPAGSKQQTFWKYNFFQHMSEFHLENGNLPPCPPQLTVETHITK